MRKIFLLFFLFPCAALSNGDTYYQFNPIEIDAYGPGVHSDQFGRSIRLYDQRGKKVSPIVRIKKPNGYGLGLHMDEYGRAVRAKPD